jgi:hypothetical protein
MIKTEKGTKIQRDTRIGVGKRVGLDFYVHKSCEDRIAHVSFYHKCKNLLPSDFKFEIIKIGVNYVSFISSPDWDVADEPTVGESIRVGKDGTIKRTVPSGLIYRHKWLFVRPDYTGFDVKASEIRSARWTSLSGIDYKRIGRKTFWDTNVLPRLQ